MLRDGFPYHFRLLNDVFGNFRIWTKFGSLDLLFHVEVLFDISFVRLVVGLFVCFGCLFVRRLERLGASRSIFYNNNNVIMGVLGGLNYSQMANY